MRDGSGHEDGHERLVDMGELWGGGKVDGGLVWQGGVCVSAEGSTGVGAIGF